MIQIDSVEIRYFRSIYRIRLRKLTDVVVLAGRNDIGKSNILKALNLFFNNHTDWNTQLDFNQDFSRRRLGEVRKETIKGKQFIQIAVGFIRGLRYEKSLPERFTVKRTWFRDSLLPDTKSSLPAQFKLGQVPTQNLDRSLASLQRYLNTIRFEYVPAIKDQYFFTYMLGLLQDIIFEKGTGESGIVSAVEQLNLTVEKEATELQEEFQRVTGVSTDIHLPDQLGELFRAFVVATKSGNDEMPLNLRGDGIRSRFLPSLLHYISQHSKLHHIWGFEEPENSLEHALATKLARDVAEVYSREAQVFITSHSPAFFGLKDGNVSVYRVFSVDGSTTVEQVTPHRSPLLNVLEQELGLMEFQEQYQREYEAKLATLEAQQKELEAVRQEIDKATSPVLLTEGKWDAVILEEAWKRLYKSKQHPFRIIPCDPTPGDPAHGAGGALTLKACLETVRPDEPITVGLFDRDREGHEKGFQDLNANFLVMPGESGVKIQRTGTAAAIVLPVVPGREKYAEVQNFVLEFYFDDIYIQRGVQGKGLILEQAEVEQTVVGTGCKLGRKLSTEPHLRQIQKGSKKAFAELVVLQFPDEAFVHFDFLFKTVEKAIAELEKMRNAHKRKPI